jgi:hypothetical protein|tara:strand:+ start:296 stop:586 length:291 start_codon:yes stop_codon:yes gene_type:complete
MPKKSKKSTKNRRVINVRERNLGREGALGLAHFDYYGENKNLIEVDPRQNSQEYLDTLIHEALHCIFPDMSETEIVKHSSRLARLVWRQGYRRIQD